MTAPEAIEEMKHAAKIREKRKKLSETSKPTFLLLLLGFVYIVHF